MFTFAVANRRCPVCWSSAARSCGTNQSVPCVTRDCAAGTKPHRFSAFYSSIQFCLKNNKVTAIRLDACDRACVYWHATEIFHHHVQQPKARIVLFPWKRCFTLLKAPSCLEHCFLLHSGKPPSQVRSALHVITTTSLSSPPPLIIS